MAEKFHSEADKTVYQRRSLAPSQSVEEASTEKPSKTTEKTTPAKSASPKKES
jgi:hypothetical protein